MSFHIVGSACGDACDMYVSFRVWSFAGCARWKLTPWDYYRERFWAIFLNGVYVGTFYAPANGDIEGVLPPSAGATVANVYAEEVGDWDEFPEGTMPDEMAKIQEAESSDRLCIEWRSSYTATGVTGDAQLTGITVSGIRRGQNVADIPGYTTRGRVYYTITAVGGARIVRWWNGTRLISEGYRTGDGAVSCVEMNASGVTVACTLAYTGDVLHGAAFMDFIWPESYQIHYTNISWVDSSLVPWTDASADYWTE